MNAIIESSNPFRVLSLDGGGAKGFYTLGILSEMEALAKRPLCECFDLIFGTSTGAIIAALLARGGNIETVLSTYREHVPPIMKDQSFAARTSALRSHVGAVFTEQTADVFTTGIGIVATNWRDKRPFLFKNRSAQAHAAKSSFVPFFGVSVADAVIASCSAYPFFDLYEVKKSNGDQVLCADGGFCANNPTLYAIADTIGSLALALPRSRVRVMLRAWDRTLNPKLGKKQSASFVISNWLGTPLVRLSFKQFSTQTRVPWRSSPTFCSKIYPWSA